MGGNTSSLRTIHPPGPTTSAMAEERKQRIDSALSSIVDAILPTSPDEDDVMADERHEAALERVGKIIDR